MTHRPPSLPSDRQLISSARTGNDSAWDELMKRHADAVKAVAAAGSRTSPREVTRGLDGLRREFEDASAPDSISIRAFRPSAIATVTGGRYGPLFDDDGRPHPSTDDHRVLARAFGRLPEPWQTVLWHAHVDSMDALDVSVFTGRPVDEIGELLETAERGLVDAFIIEYLDKGPVTHDVAGIVPLLSGHVHGDLSPGEERLVAHHLSEQGDTRGSALPPPGTRSHTTEDSRRLVAIATSLPSALPVAISPGITALTVEQYRRAVADTAVAAQTASPTRWPSSRRRVLIAVTGVVAVIGLVGVALVAASRSGTGDAVDDTPVVESSTASPASDPGAASRSDIDIVVRPGTRADGADELETRLGTSVDVPAPVFAGGTGTLDFSMTNGSAEVVDAEVEMGLPDGISFDSVVSDEGACASITADEVETVSCALSVQPGVTEEYSLKLAFQPRTVGSLRISGESMAAPIDTPVVAARSLVHNSVARGDVLVVGNTVMTCGDFAPVVPPATVPEERVEFDCDEVVAGTGDVVNRWDVSMRFVGADSERGLANGSSALLELPESASVVSANLYWAGDIGEGGESVRGNDVESVVVVGPDGEINAVNSGRVKFGEEDATQYIGRADVTDLITVGGEYIVGDITSVEAEGSFGAWSLVVVIDDDAMPRRQRVVTDPFVWVAPPPFSYSTGLPVPEVAGVPGRLQLLAFEGERGFGEETLVAGGVAIGGDNPFDSSIEGERTPAFDNNLGVDIDAYDLTIDAPTGNLLIEARSDDDGFRLAVIALTVDLET